MGRFVLVAVVLLRLSAPAAAIVGDAPIAEWRIARPTVMVSGPRGPCSGTVLAQDVVLTAAHCVKTAAAYSIAGYVAARPFRLADVTEVVLHPQYIAETRSGVDLALLKLAKPLPPGFAPAFLDPRPVAIGDRLIVVGYGVATQSDDKSIGVPRMAMLVVTRRSGDRFTMSDRSSRLGGCGGDSGAPAFAIRGGIPTFVGIVVGGTESRCGAATVAMAFAAHRQWIVETARKLGSPLD